MTNPNAQGKGYSVGDILPLAGGTTPVSTYCSTNTKGGIAATCAATVQVNAVSVVSASAAGSGGTGTHSAKCTFTGTDGTALSGQPFQATVSTDINGNISGTVVNYGGYYTGMPSATTTPASGCGFTSVTLTLSFGVAETQMVFNGIYSYPTPGMPGPQFPSSPAGVDPNNHYCLNTSCLGATFTTATSQQTNIFSVGTDDTPALMAAVAAQTKLASLATNPTNMNSKICIYAPAGVYSVIPLNTSGLTGVLAANACVLGDGEQQTIFHLRPNVGGDLFAWHNANQNNSFPLNGSTSLLNVNQSGPSCHGFDVEGDRTSSADQTALHFYGNNDSISCTDVQVNFLLGSALRCADPDPGNPDETAKCSESHFHDLRFNRVGDGTAYPVVYFHANGSSDGVNNIDMTDVDIYNPRGTGMYFTDTPTSGGSAGNADHNIAMARIRWEGSEFSVAGVTTDLLQIDGGTPKGGPNPALGGTSYITCLECRWENPYLGASAIHFTAGASGPPPGNIVLDGRVIGNQYGFGKGVQIDAGTSLSFNLSVLSSVDYNFSMAANTAIASIFLNGYGSEFGWTYNVPSAVSGSLIGPIQRFEVGANGSAIQAAQPNAANACNGTRGPGAADLQTDCTLPTQGAIGKDSFAGAGKGNSATGNFASITGGQGNVASGTNAVVAGGTSNTASGLDGFVGGTGAADSGRLATNCWSSGAAASGQSQTCVETLTASTSGTTSKRLTANGAATATTTNAFNIATDNTSYSLRINLTAIDVSAPTMANYTAVWTMPLVLTRLVGPGSVALTGNLVPSIFANGAAASVAISADMAVGGLNITFMPPSMNTDIWDVAARIESVEVK